MKYISKIVMCLSILSIELFAQLGIVKIISPQSNILINGRSYNISKNSSVALPAGWHEIVVRQGSGLMNNLPDFVEKIFLNANEIRQIEVRFRKLFQINTFPSGASVVVDGVAKGRTPLVCDESELAEKEIVIQRSLFLDEKFNITKEQLTEGSILLNLKIVGNPTLANDNQFVNLQYKEQGLSRYRNLLLGASILSLGTGAIAVVYKDRADRAFEDAKKARRIGQDKLRISLENKTRKNDRISTVAFVGMQINVGAIMYLLLTANSDK